jgi:hypothetical protein
MFKYIESNSYGSPRIDFSHLSEPKLPESSQNFAIGQHFTAGPNLVLVWS